MASDESPNASVSVAESLDHQLKQAAAATGDRPVSLTVRRLLSWWGEDRRTPEIVDQIQTDLTRFGLTTDPPFTKVWAESEVTLRPLPPNATLGAEESDADGTLRIGHLPTANRGVATVSGTDPISTAITIMTVNDYSQLAVMEPTGTFSGVISERSITKAVLRSNLTTVADARVGARGVKREDYVLTLVDELCEHGFCIVIDDEGRPVGIVTVTDLLEELVSRHSPILTISTIELRVRHRVFARLDHAEIEPYLPKRGKRDRHAAPTLGRYPDMLKNPHRWRKLDWNIDHGYFIKMLRIVAATRNELVHFTPDPPTSERLNEIERFAKALRDLT